MGCQRMVRLANYYIAALGPWHSALKCDGSSISALAAKLVSNQVKKLEVYRIGLDYGI